MPATQLVGRNRAAVGPVDEDLTGGGLLEAVEHPQGRGLAAPGRTDEHHQFAGGHGQLEVVDRGALGAGEDLGDVPELDGDRGLGFWVDGADATHTTQGSDAHRSNRQTSGIGAGTGATVRSASHSERAKQPRRWSLTTPRLCMAA